jgi:GNAT superfamily N-acetyltransferase
VHRIQPTVDIEAYWRERGNLRNVRTARKRCAQLQHSINWPGAARWVISRWSRTWGVEADGTSEDRIAVAEYLENQGLHHTFLLSEGDKMVAGSTMLTHQDSLVASVIYRDPAYDSLGTGTRLIDWNFSYARENGFTWIDLGGGHDYKRKWAPADGYRWDIVVAPAPHHLADRAARWVRSTMRRLSRRG